MKNLVDNYAYRIVSVYNIAIIQRNGIRQRERQASVLIFRPFTKIETSSAKDTNGVETFVITIDPDSEVAGDYIGDDYLIIVDEMDNLVHEVYPTEEVKAGNTVLQKITEQEAAGLDPINDQNKYDSVSYETVNNASGKVTGVTMTLKIWYPTILTYTIEHSTFVMDYDDLLVNETSSYSNTVTINTIFHTIKGTVQKMDVEVSVHGSNYGMRMIKVDGDSAYVRDDGGIHYRTTIPGAVFKVYRYLPQEGIKLLTTLETGEDGTVLF